MGKTIGTVHGGSNRITPDYLISEFKECKMVSVILFYFCDFVFASTELAAKKL